jgi:hypothetical protein
MNRYYYELMRRKNKGWLRDEKRSKPVKVHEPSSAEFSLMVGTFLQFSDPWPDQSLNN